MPWIKHWEIQIDDYIQHSQMAPMGKAARRKAHKMEAIGTLAGGVAHDLNNILSGVVSYPELLLLQLPKGSPLAKPLETIMQSGRKAAAIVQDLLTLARRGAEIFETVNLNTIVPEYLDSPEYRKLRTHHYQHVSAGHP